MELSKIKINGHEINVIFNGGHYFFHSSFYGWVCVADRDEKAYYDNDVCRFTLRVGNRHTIGGSLCDSTVLAAAKRFITKSENKYIKKSVEYVNDLGHSLDNAYMDINFIER